jgi:uncharacterized lipoprotein YbaY
MNPSPPEPPPTSENAKRSLPGSVILTAVVLLAIALLLAGLYITGFFGRPEEAQTTPVTAFISIEQPQEAATIDLTQPLTVSGTAGGLFEGNLVVQVLDVDGNVLVEAPTTIQAPNAGLGESGPWNLELEVQAVPDSQGTVRSYAQSAEDGSTVAEDQVVVSFGAVAVEPYIEISEPVEGTVVDLSAALRVQGMAGGLFEGNVVVEVLDENGASLAMAPTTIQSEYAGVGGEGPWSVDLAIQPEPRSLGRVRAYAGSPKDGSIIAEDAVEVSFGQAVPTNTPSVRLEDAAWLLVTLNGQTPLDGYMTWAEFKDGKVAGSAGCNRYDAAYNAVEAGNSGGSLSISPAASSRMACGVPEGIMEQEAQYLALLETAAAYEIVDGRLSVRDDAGSEVLAFQSAVLGTVEAAQDAQLPEAAAALVSLDDISRADAPAVTINRVELSGMAGFPFPFAVTYNPVQIDPRMDYAITVRINDQEGNLAFINTQAYIVITKDHPSVVEVMVEEIR